MKYLYGFAGLLISLSVASETVSEAIPVTVKSFSAIATDVVSNAPAEIVVNDQPDVSAELSAKILGINVLEGDSVDAGETLVQLDCAKYELIESIARNSRELAQARLKFARSQLERAKNLKKKNSISDELLDQRETELKEAIANLKTQKNQLDQAQIDVLHCDIKAPFDAVVIKRLVSQGSYVQPATPVISLLRINDVEVEAKLRRAEVTDIQQAKDIWLKSGSKRYDLRLRSVLPSFDAITKTAKAKFEFVHESLPWPGQQARIHWITGSKQIPAEFVIRRNQLLGVFVIEQGKARFIHLEKAVEGRAVNADLSADMQLIEEGRYRVNDGDTISITNSDKTL